MIHWFGLPGCADGHSIPDPNRITGSLLHLFFVPLVSAPNHANGFHVGVTQCRNLASGPVETPAICALIARFDPSEGIDSF